ncbi:TetR/AcrR family transcriptional regulator [Vibrio vulnificus]|nr:TetR/AcrR family transcriptional regulator [Vibrio vulnificus]
MAKISAEQREKNKNEFDLVVEEIFWERGWDAITLNEMAKRTGKPKPTLQNYYPDRTHFGEALRGKVFPVVMSCLDLSSPREFKISWETQLSANRKFRMVVNLLVSNATSEQTNDMTINGIVRLRHMLSEKWGSDKEAFDSLMWVLGLSVLRLAENTIK